MHEVFWAARDPENHGHPGLGALLYAYCPRAARWWAQGEEPVGLPLPERQALQDMVVWGTRGLRAALRERGLADAWAAVADYLRQAAAYRLGVARRGLDPAGAEEDRLFLETLRWGVPVTIQRAEGLRALGGVEGLRRYVRTWAFLAPAWAGRDTPPAEPIPVGEARLDLTLPPGTPQPLRFPLWQVGERYGLLPTGIDALVEGLAATGVLRDAGGETAGRLVRLDLAGAPQPLQGSPPPESVLRGLGRAARQGPYLPLRALQGGRPACRGCGYQHRCWVRGRLSGEEE
jgi:hypothetical protein